MDSRNESRRDEGGTEERILDAASRVFLRRGTAGARMSEIAEEADVNQALLHYYFSSKADLARAVFRGAARQLLPRVLQVLISGATLDEKVRRVVEIEIEFLLQHPQLPGYILSELSHHPERADELFEALSGSPLGDVAPRVMNGLRAQIDAAVEAGELRSIEPETFVVNLISLCIFPFAARPMVSAIAGLDDAGFEDMMRRRKRELPEFFLQGLRP
ncbi:MAG: TetR/AcrR family transcriptional regulator [Gemmatimonadota bacterium]